MIKDRLKDARVYDENGNLIGVAEVELADIEYIAEKLEALGISGNPEMPLEGHVENMTAKFKFKTLSSDTYELLKPEAKLLTVYAVTQNYDPAQGKNVEEQIRTVLKVIPKKFPLGKLQKGKPMDVDIEMTVIYLKQEIEGEEVLEIDPLNYIFKVKGIDYLADTRQKLGMS